MQPKSRYYHPELDVLRFFAAFGVFAYHASPDHWRGRWLSVSGSYGVDLFFALSSFLITTLLIREREQQGYLDIKAFYLRRILRIWPLYFFFIGLACIVALAIRSETLGVNYVLGFFLLFGNWVFAFQGVPKSVAAPLWSISLEEQFYLTWPQLVKRLGPNAMKWAAGVMLAVAFVTRAVLARHGASTEILWYNTLVRLDPLALGILAAIYLYSKDYKAGKTTRILLACCGIFLWLAVSAFLPPTGPIVPFWSAVLGYPLVTLGSLALILAVYNAPAAMMTVLGNRRLVYLGKISYGIYVYHLLSLRVCGHLLKPFQGKAMASVANWTASFSMTLILAALSYHFLESPFLRLKDRYARVKTRPV